MSLAQLTAGCLPDNALHRRDGVLDAVITESHKTRSSFFRAIVGQTVADRSQAHRLEKRLQPRRRPSREFSFQTHRYSKVVPSGYALDYSILAEPLLRELK